MKPKDPDRLSLKKEKKKKPPLNIRKIIRAAVDNKGSDIYLWEGSKPFFRVDGVVRPVKHRVVTHEDIAAIVDKIVPARLKKILEKDRGVDLSYHFKDLTRCRVIVFYEQKQLKIVMRLVPLKVPTIEEMDLPPILHKIADTPRGLVIVTGPTGSGKTTSLAAMVDYINSTRRKCIITLENPIEFIHENKKSILFQREVGDDVPDFHTGLIQALRQAPDIILVGEMRRLETIRTAIQAAQVGHLVFGTLHTSDATQTLERIIAAYPEGEHALLRNELASHLKTVITQNLVRRIGGKGRVAALEILIVTHEVQKLIDGNRIRDIREVIKSGEEGMRTFDQSLALLTLEKKISVEEAESWARDVYAYRRYLKGILATSDEGGIIIGYGD